MKGKTTLNECGGNGLLRDETQRGILLLLVLIGVFVFVPGVCAYHNTGDLIDDFVYYSSACAGYGNAVWVDTDGVVNGATYGKYETMVVFETISGEGYPDSFGSYPDFYFFTADKTNCGGGTLDRGRIVIYFVDMLAAGFDQGQPATWTYKSVPKIYISASHDATVASGVPYGSAYQQIKAYRNRGQSGLVSGVVEPDPGFGSYRDYYFYDAAGIRELYVTTDFAENTLNNFQIETGAQPNTVTVNVPNGGESWQQGTTHTIQWTRTGTMSDNYFNIELLKGGAVNKFLATVTLDAANPTQSYSWTVPAAQTLGSDYQIRVTNTGTLPYSDTSNAYFSITSTSVKTVTVTSPNGGESWQAGTQHSVTWSQTGLSGTNVKIDLYKDRVFYRSIMSSVAATAGTYAWTIPADVPAGSAYEVWITSLSNPAVYDWTDGWLTITAAPTIRVITPDGNQTWYTGTSHTITWTQTGLSGTNVKILLMKNYGFNVARTITASVPATSGSYTWTVPDTLASGTDYWVKIVSLSYPDIQGDMWSGWITIPGTIIVTSPNGGETWKANTPHSITWTQKGLSGTNVKIDLYKDRVFDRSIVSSVAATAGSYAWTIPGDVPSGSNYEVWITTLSEPIFSDWTDGWLTIADSPTIRVITPDGDQSWNPGTAHAITWTQTGLKGTYVEILLMKGYGYNVAKVIAPSVPATSGSYTWTVPSTLIAGSDYWVKIVSLSYPAVQGDMWTGWITIRGRTLKPLPGCILLPTDPDHDGIYEDLNGNGRLDFADVVLYFNQMTWIAANEPIAAFDLNGNDRIDFADIVALFNEI